MSKKFSVNFIIVYFLLGVFIAPEFELRLNILIYASLAIFLVMLAFLKNKKVIVFALASLSLILGIIRFSFAVPNYDRLDLFKDGKQDVVLEGFISSYPQRKDRTQTFYLNTKDISRVDGSSVGDKVFIITSKINEYKYGQNLSLKGKLEVIENSDEFNFREFFISRGAIYKMMVPEIRLKDGSSGNYFMKLIFDIRKSFEERIEDVFVEPFSSLVLGLLLGVKSIPQDLMEIFNKVSLSHIIVVSGYNLSIIANFLKGIFSKFSRKLSFWIPLAGIIFFVVLVGAEPPVVRAAIMAFCVLLAREKGRKADSIFALLFAGLIMVILNPFILRYDPGFQLSFISTLGILMFSDHLNTFLTRNKINQAISELISSTLAAQFLILPLVLYYFERISLIGPISNFIVLPFVPLVMLFAFLASVFGFITFSLAYYLSLVPTLLMFLIIRLCEFLASLPFSSLNFRVSYITLFVYYLIVIFIYINFGKRKNV
jgi:competence protein ComEC